MDEEEIKIPEFDEKKFKETEKRKAKTSIISFSFGIIIATISRFLWVHLSKSIRLGLIFLFAIACIGFLAKILQYLKIDIKSFGKKEWLGSIAFYFFTWLAFFILLINPPFYDASPPQIEAIAMPTIQEINENISIFAKITDNVGIKKVKINLSGWHEMIKYKGFYLFNYSDSKDMPFEIVAVDKNGHSSSYKGVLHFRKKVIYSHNATNINSSYKIKIWVMKNISNEKFRVFYKINGNEVNATWDGQEGDYYIYKTTPSYEGWKNGENKIRIYAEVIHYFEGSKIKLSSLVVGNEYTFKTIENSNIGTSPSPQIKDLPKPKSLRTPGFEIIAFLAAITIIILWKRKR